MGIGHLLESALRNTSAASMTDIFILIIAGVFAIAVHQGFKGKHSRFLEHAPSVLTSLGILGTFVGIVIGLLDFNHENVEGSIGNLLGGLKTAFTTSLVGMLLSIVLKGLDTWKFAPMRDQAETPDEVGPSHIYQRLTRQIEVLESLERSISGTEEGTLVGQQKLLRADLADFRGSLLRQHQGFEEKLFAEMRNFAELLSKSATEQVIEALRQVIQDFNKHLVEQFGDNFKALDAAVQKMVVWQDEYKGHIEAVQARIEAAVTAIEATRVANEAIAVAVKSTQESVERISEECKAIPGSMDSLQGVMQVNQHQIGELSRHLETFVAMREQAVSAVPQLQAHMEKLSAEIRTGLEGIMTRMHEGATEFGRSADRVNSALGEAANTISNETEKVSADLRDTTVQFNQSVRGTLEVLENGSKELDRAMRAAVQTAAESMTKEIQRTLNGIQESMARTVQASLDGMSRSVTASVDSTQTALRENANRTLGAVEEQVKQASQRVGSALNAQLDAFGKGLERELEMVLRDLAKGLATISRRIADDHAELSKRLGNG